MAASQRGTHGPSLQRHGLDWSQAVGQLAGELRRRADGPGIEGMVADGLLQLLHRSAQLMTDCGTRLEQAITPTRVPRPRRASPHRAGSRPTRVRRVRPDA